VIPCGAFSSSFASFGPPLLLNRVFAQEGNSDPCVDEFTALVAYLIVFDISFSVEYKNLNQGIVSKKTDYERVFS